MVQAVIFDLDGTLLNSITDIAESMNEVLEKYNFPTHSIEAYKQIIGRGIDNLVIDSLPNSVTQQQYEKYFTEMREVYGKRWMLKTRPYSGINEMLGNLKKNKIKTAVLSNKPQKYTELAVNELLSNHKFDLVFGARENIPIKPHPQAANEILENLAVKPENALFVGDTSIDMKTAENAGIKSVGVSWGFRKIEELKNAGAKYIILKPEELSEFIV